jgi:hypothetical protein
MQWVVNVHGIMVEQRLLLVLAHDFAQFLSQNARYNSAEE